MTQRFTFMAAFSLLLHGGVIAALLHTPTGVADQPQQNPASDNVEIHRLTSAIFGNTRAIRVLLPPGYRQPERAAQRYPVLYLNDGIMAFRPQALGLEETVHRLIHSGSIPPLIVVGIDNGGSTDKTKNEVRDRANEFLPYSDGGFAPGHLYPPDPPRPQGKRYPDFLLKEVVPLIAKHYRVKSGAEDTAIGGFSYGGVAALYTAMRHPEHFGKLLLESTPLWIGTKKELLGVARQTKRWPARIYIGSGTQESPEAAIKAEGRREQELLCAIIRQQAPQTILRVFTEEGGKHEPAAWRGRLAAALQSLFGNQESVSPRKLR